ncbi:hypothetical protein ACVWZV_001483 [Bradyrhizobium sp. GM5.1]
MPSWIRCSASLSRPRVRPASSSVKASAISSSSLAALGADLAHRARGQHQERDQQSRDCADPDLADPIDCRCHGIGMMHRRNQQHDDGGDRRCIEARVDRGDEGEWRDRQHQQAQQAGLGRIRDQDRDGAPIDGAADGAEHVIARRLQRAPDAQLGHDQRGQHRPERQQQMQRGGDRVGRGGRDRDPDRQAQLRSPRPDPVEHIFWKSHRGISRSSWSLPKA